MTDCAYIFLDESGNLDFGASGSRYFVLTSVGMRRPFPSVAALDAYKHDCIESGTDIEYFHCYRDRKEVRNVVFDLIAAHLGRVHIDCLVIEKSRIIPALQEDVRFYPAMLNRLLKLVLAAEVNGNAEQVVVITDTIPVNRKRRAVESAVRIALPKFLPPGMQYRIFHHQSRSHYGLQMADYCCWAIFRKWQKGESIWYDRIRSAIRRELEFPVPDRNAGDGRRRK